MNSLSLVSYDPRRGYYYLLFLLPLTSFGVTKNDSLEVIGLCSETRENPAGRNTPLPRSVRHKTHPPLPYVPTPQNTPLSHITFRHEPDPKKQRARPRARANLNPGSQGPISIPRRAPPMGLDPGGYACHTLCLLCVPGSCLARARWLSSRPRVIYRASAIFVTTPADGG